MKNQITNKNLKEFEKMVQRYEQAILDVDNGKHISDIADEWEGFYDDDQDLCLTVGFNCRKCVLGGRFVTDDHACNYDPDDPDFDNKVYPCRESTSMDLSAAVHQEERGGYWTNRRELFPSLKARLKWLLKRADANGVVLK